MTSLRRILPDDLPRLKSFWRSQWAGEDMIVHGQIFRPEDVQGFVNEDWTGVVTYVLGEGGCEIISLDALKEGSGIGTALVEAVIAEARGQGCGRVFLSTTNDNLHALGFYQRRGFRLCAVRPGAVDDARRHKPGIPLMGENDIPMRDEIELELELRDAGEA